MRNGVSEKELAAKAAGERVTLVQVHDAIKEYRIAHGVTLKAAKEIIDIYLQKLDGR